jgi:hypothetical protein
MRHKASLRWHYPNQVHRSKAAPSSQPVQQAPVCLFDCLGPIIHPFSKKARIISPIKFLLFPWSRGHNPQFCPVQNSAGSAPALVRRKNFFFFNPFSEKFFFQFHIKYGKIQMIGEPASPILQNRKKADKGDHRH